MSKSLSYAERIKIETLLKQGVKPYKIAEILKRAKQTIYNEVKRGSVKQLNPYFIEIDKYCADAGERVKRENYSRCGVDLKIGCRVDILALIEKVVKEKQYSFYSALAYIRDEMGIDINLTIQTLYSYLEKGLFLNLSYADLPEGRRKRKRKKSSLRHAWNNKGRSIEDRPDHVKERLEFGHWEGDTVYGGKNENDKTCLLVLTERKTRLEIVEKIRDRTSGSVNKALRKIAKEWKDDVKTITFDNGSEFTGWRKIEKMFNCSVFFAHPFCSGERGSNEFNNRLIRRFIPKGSAIGKYTNQQIKEIETWINNMPRKILQGKTAIKCYKNIKFLNLLTN